MSVKVEKTENKYQSLLDVAKNELDKDKQNTNYYDGHTIETKAFSNFIFGEQFKRWGRHDVWSKEYEELCNIIDNTEKELQEGSIGFEKAIDRMVSAYQKYDSIAKIDVGGFDCSVKNFDRVTVCLKIGCNRHQTEREADLACITLHGGVNEKNSHFISFLLNPDRTS